jgi:F-type H+-transporting ATPase subunit delta
MKILSKTLARPCAKAAFEVAVSTHHIDGWEQFLKTARSIVEYESIGELLKDPRVKPAMLRPIFFEMLKKNFFNVHCQNFLNLLMESRKLSLLPEISELFIQLKYDYHKIRLIYITSAFPLTPKEEAQLKEAIETRLNERVRWHCKLSERLKAGAVVHSDDTVLLDHSLESWLEQLKNSLKTGN